LVDEAGASEDVANWLKALPESADPESFLDRRPRAAEAEAGEEADAGEEAEAGSDEG
jgi:hypothetical protein